MPSENQSNLTEFPQKSSMEILSELFGSFDAEPPVIVKKEKSDDKKHKKSKKKHKHKEKKHKKKSKKRNRSCSSDSSAVDLTDILIKKEQTEESIDVDLVKLIKEEPEEDKSKPEFDKKTTSLFDATIIAIKEAEDDKPKKKEKHKKKHHKSSGRKKRKRSKSNSPIKEKKARTRSPSASPKRKKTRHRSRDCDKKDSKHRHEKKSKEWVEYYTKCRDTSKERRHSYDRDKHTRDIEYKYKDRDRSKDREAYKEKYINDKKKRYSDGYKNDNYYDKEDKYFVKNRYRSFPDRDREKRPREKSEEATTHIDKKKLLEIARKNAIQMMKSGSLPGALSLGPQAQEKVIAAIKSGGKTVEELTDFCKTLSKKEELGELSSVSEENDSDTDSEKQFHHPFLIKERPVSITMNIKNSIPLPIKNSQERASELRIQFPVSSGQQHRKTEGEWIPVAPKKVEPTAPPAITTVAVIPTPTTIKPQKVSPPPSITVSAPQVFPTPTNEDQNIDIASIVSQRLSAMRKLQENPNDVQALTCMYKAQKEMNSWAESKQQVGQFTGSTGAQILSQAELSSGYQAWARKDQLQTAAPVSGGMGMHLLRKMGWKPGEGLGKEKTGTLEPLLLEVKLDKKGIVAKEEQKKKIVKVIKPTVKTLQGKHPVSLLGEYASKNKLGVPQYDLCFECGPDHKKNFLFKVIVNNIEYKPQVASPNKKEAKANAALMCLQTLGILPTPSIGQPT